jgi:hypothetical protein
MMSEERGKHLSFFSFLLEKKACRIFSRHPSQALPNKMNFWQKSSSAISKMSRTENQPARITLNKIEKKEKMTR